MDLRRTPTLIDLAKMLDSIATRADGAYPETLHVPRWLIESSPADSGTDMSRSHGLRAGMDRDRGAGEARAARGST